MSFLVIISFIVLAVGMFGGITMLFAGMWIREAPIKDALNGQPMHKREINPELLSVVSSPAFMPTVILTCELPALLAVWYLRKAGYTESALIAGCIAFVLGWFNARFLTRSMRKNN